MICVMSAGATDVGLRAAKTVHVERGINAAHTHGNKTTGSPNPPSPRVSQTSAQAVPPLR